MAERMDLDPPAGSPTADVRTHAGFDGYSHHGPMQVIAQAHGNEGYQETGPRGRIPDDEGQSRDDHGDGESEVSDVDSDYLELNAETAKLDASIEAFRAAQRMGNDDDDYTGIGIGSGIRTPAAGAPVAAAAAKASGKPVRKGGNRRGPRKAAKPSPDILYRLSLATEAYHGRRYQEAHEMLAEIIRINAETFDAWTLLSTVFEEQGDRHGALMCLVAAAHLTPKVGRMWINAATYALDSLDALGEGSRGRGEGGAGGEGEGDDQGDDGNEGERNGLLQTAMQCYSAAVRANPADVAARTGKADVLMTLGHASLAVSQYQRALRHRPLNIRTVRNLADVALDARDPRQSSAAAMAAYRRVIDHCQAGATTSLEEGDFEWSDLRIYLEFFAMLERWADAARELKEVSRWLLGRREEAHLWEGEGDDGGDRLLRDDREWDVHDNRRISVPGYEPARFPLESYGLGLPVDLRARLCVYRLKLGQEHEAMLHLELLDPKDEQPQDTPALERFRDFPDCLKDVGVALLERDRPEEAMGCFELYRRIAAGSEDVLVDSDMLVSQGRCYLTMGDKAAAEECFIAAIEEDDENIDARFELAKIYEGEQEKEGREEAFLLVNEALNLEAQHVEGADGAPKRAPRRLAPHMPGELRRRERMMKPRKERRRMRYRPRRLGDSEERRKYDQERTAALSERYRLCLNLKDRLGSGDTEAISPWLEAAKELVDDFRSSKEFYPWDMYVRSQGFVTYFADQQAPPHANSKLIAMAARLQQNLAPTEGEEHSVAPVIIRHEHRGIPFNEWLDLFLEYAINLAFTQQAQESYEICTSAKDSVVFKSKENAFLIHLTHATCAVVSGDEEQCVSVARFFMREYTHCTDSYRIFAALCRVCQAPVSWYSSGPAQKFILRQIRQMDRATTASGPDGDGDGTGTGTGNTDLDVCLLTIYGHIMFTTTSYTYALSYFMRAASIDPDNPMINLSLGIAYIHYALKRQATNRQYLLTQGFAFLARYHGPRSRSASAAERQEANFNMGRAYHIVGLAPLAAEYYGRVLDEARSARAAGGARAGTLLAGGGGEEEEEMLVLEAAYNLKTICFGAGDLEGARAVTDEWLVL